MSHVKNVSQASFWKDATDENESTHTDARRGGALCTNIHPKMMADIQIAVSRLIAKADWELHYQPCRVLDAHTCKNET